MKNSEEYLEIVNEKDEVLGIAPRTEIHGNPSLMHRVVHVLVFNKKRDLLLQKRSCRKDVAPGKWDTSVGGHVEIGEGLFTAAKREMDEELGITCHELEYLYSYTHSNPYETEFVTTYRCTYDGRIGFNKDEIDEVRYWGIDDIKNAMGNGILSDNFEDEYRTYIRYQTPLVSGL